MHFTKWTGVCNALVFTFIFALSAGISTAQIAVNEGFEASTLIPTGWTSSGGWSVFTVPVTPPNQNQIPCTGSRSIRANIFGVSTSNRSLAAPLFTSNGTDISVSFQYKIIDWAGGSLSTGNVPTAGNWGSLSLQYSVDGGVTYTNFYTIDQSNHTTSGSCAAVSQTIPGALIPNGASARIRLLGVWASGDWWAYADNIVVNQLATTPPACNAALTSPVPNSTNAAVNGLLAWSAASGAATGYQVTVTQITGGPSVIYDATLGAVTSVNVGPLLATTLYQVDIVPFNANGTAIGCTSYSFTTLNPAICQAPLLISTLPYSTSDNTANYGDDYESVNLPLGPALFPALSTGTLTGSYLGGDDVVYAYTPSSNAGINITIPTGHGTWLGVYVFTGCPFSQTVAFHLASSSTGRAINNIPVVAGTTYYILISTFPAPQASAYTLNVTEVAFDCPAIPGNIGAACNDGNPGTFNDLITAQCECVGTPYDCQNLNANIGSACSDGNPFTVGDVVTANCECVGNLVEFAGCTNGIAFGSATPICDGPTSTITNAWTAEFSTITVTTGNTYNFSLSVPTYFVTITDANLNILAFGLGAASYVATFDGIVRFYSTFGPDCPTTGGGATVHTRNVSAICAPVFDCPELSANIGDGCDDGNATTEGDIVLADCSCAGTSIFDCPELSANIGDACDDGDTTTENDAVQGDCSCVGTPIDPVCTADPGCAADINSAAYATVIANDPFCCNNVWDSICANAYAALGGLPSQEPSCFNCPSLLANIGDACDDGDATTGNDLINADCLCAGTPINLFDCPDLAANIGDACNDGNANTIGDIVLADCTCVGIALPENDTACGAEPIECGDIISGTTVGAAADNVPICGTTNGTGGGLWYLLQPTQSGQIVVNTCGSAFDTKLRIYAGSCNAFTCVGGNDDFSGCGPGFSLNSQVTFAAVAGTSYYILVHGFSSSVGAFTLSVSCTLFDCPEIQANIGNACDDGNSGTFSDTIQADCTCAGTPAQTNDTACDADAISCGDTVSGTTQGTAADVLGFCGTSDGSNGGVWYALTATENASVIASLCGSGTTFDSKLRVFEGACDALICVTGNDDFCGLQSEVSFTASAGTTYYILVHGFGTAAGPYSLAVSCETIYDCPELSANIGDACDDGDANTENDSVQADCSCAGTSIFDCPELQANVGDSCDDGDASTGNDTVGEDCTCAGTPINPCNVNGGTVSTTSTTAVLCKGDSVADLVQLTVSGNVGQGLFGIIEQGSQDVVAVSQTGLFNIENLPAGNYQGGYISVENISQLANITNLSQLSGCFDLSNRISIRSILLVSGTLSTSNPPLVCSGEISVTLAGNVGPNTRFVLLNADATIVISVNQTGVFNFSNLADGTYRVTAITFRGGVDLNSITPPVLPACIVNSNILTFIKISCTAAALTSSPNPTSGASFVTFSVPTEDYTTLEVYDMSGRKVTELFRQVAQADAQYRLEFDGLGLPNGVYIYRLTTSHEVVIAKFMIAK